MEEERIIPENPFQIGDKVEVIEGATTAWIANEDGTWSGYESWTEFIGKQGIIIALSGFWNMKDDYRFKYSIDGIGAWLFEDQLKLISRHKIEG